jgi:hypothetical protein
VRAFLPTLLPFPIQPVLLRNREMPLQTPFLQVRCPAIADLD